MRCSYRGCPFESLTERGVIIHKSKFHKNTHFFPDFIRMGIIKRKLNRKESAQITKEVMDMGLKDSDSNFVMVIMKSMELLQNE